jgi:phytanoyl-CoA hydroxylase
VGDSTLSPAQRHHYQEKGYLLVPGLFDAADLEPWHARFLAIVNEELPPAPDMLVMREVMVAKGAVRPGSKAEAIAKLQDFHNDPVLFDGYARHPKLLGIVEEFCGPDIKSIHSMLINKPPHVDGRHPLHQDLLYFPFRPADQIVATWTALSPCTRENGCLSVVPGSHKGGLSKHENMDWEYVNFFYVGVADADEETERVHLEMQPGDTVVFHPLLWHGSGRNRTAGFRRAISAHYASAACRYVPEHPPVESGRPYVLVQGREHPDCI